MIGPILLAMLGAPDAVVPAGCGGAGTPPDPDGVRQSGNPILVTWTQPTPNRCVRVYYDVSSCPSVGEPLLAAELPVGSTEYQSSQSVGFFSVSFVSADQESEKVCAT